MSVRATITALVLVLAGAAHAQPRIEREVLLSLPACDPPTWQREAVRAALQLELESVGDRLSAQPTASVWRIAIVSRCTAGSDPQLRVQAPDGTTRARAVSLVDSPPELHARTLALAAAEQLRVQAGARPPPPAAAASTHAALVLTMQPTLRVFTAQRDALFGAELMLRVQRWVFGLGGRMGAYSDPLGSLNVRQATLALTYELLTASAGNFRFSLGPRGALGVLWASGAASAPSYVAAPLETFIWDAGAALSGEYALGRWAVGLRFVVGYARGARLQADERVLAHLTGLFVDAAVSVSLAL